MPDLKVEVLLPLHYNPDKKGRKKVGGIKFSENVQRHLQQVQGLHDRQLAADRRLARPADRQADQGRQHDLLGNLQKDKSQRPVLQEAEEDAGKAVRPRRNNDVLHPGLQVLTRGKCIVATLDGSVVGDAAVLPHIL